MTKYGYIVDYKDLFQSLDKAVSDYTKGPLIITTKKMLQAS